MAAVDASVNQGNDTITGSNGEDIILGGNGRDGISGNAGRDVLLGDQGEVDLENRTTWALTGKANLVDRVAMVKTLQADQGANDTINGNEDDDIILGGGNDAAPGPETLSGNTGDDVILGDFGQVTLTNGMVTLVATTDFGSGGNDTIQGNEGNDLLLGGAGNDQIDGDSGTPAPATDGNDVIAGDHATITLWDAATTQFKDASGQFNGALTDRVSQVKTTDPDAATGGADTLTGSSGQDILLGGNARDTLSGNAGRDVLLGDQGQVDLENRTTWAGAGKANLVDRVKTLQTLQPTWGANDQVNGNEDDDFLLGGGNNDLAGDNNRETLDGGTGNDLLLGDYGQITFTGGVATHFETTDRSQGGNDRMLGGAGQDVLAGGAGSDQIDGDLPTTTLAGGASGNPNGDLIFGDNVALDRTATLGSYAWKRFQTLNGTALFSGTGAANASGTPQLNPDGQPVWADWVITLLDHDTTTQALTTASNLFGDDQIAGGAGDDVIFGELGNDVIQGDGSTVLNPTLATPVSASDYAGAGSDGDDYIEGGGGQDIDLGRSGP